LLIEKGGVYVNLNPKNRYGNTPLHLAVQVRRYEIVNLLIEKCANLNSENEYGNTPLHLAIQKGDYEIIKLLIEKGGVGINLNSVDQDGWTPLHLAVYWGQYEIVKLLGHLQEPPRGVAWKR
jgi:ankyrin repeat protein